MIACDSRIFVETLQAYIDGYRYIINYGGSSSTKTFSTLQVINVIAHKKKQTDRLTSVVSKTFPHLKQGAMLDFFKIVRKAGAYDPNKHNKTDHKYKVGESIVEFFSADQPDKVHGPRRDDLFINEVINIDEQTCDQMFIRTGGTIFLDFNPKYKFWLHSDKYKGSDCKWIHSTYKDNRHLNERIKKDLEKWRMHPNLWKVYGLGEVGIPEIAKPFCYAYEHEKHIRECELNPNLTVYLSFDFNVDPITCLVSQFGPGWYYHLDEFRLSNSDVYELCEQIRVRYPNAFFVVTGDATGLSRTVSTKGNVNNYTIICRELRLAETQLKLPSVNPPIAESRTLSNALLANYPDMRISPRCAYLIEDLQWVQVKDDGQIDKAADSRRSHLLDCKRYMDNTFFNWWINKR